MDQKKQFHITLKTIMHQHEYYTKRIGISNYLSIDFHYPKKTPPFGYLAVYGAARRQLRKPDVFPRTISSCSSREKNGLTQSSPYTPTNYKGWCMPQVKESANGSLVLESGGACWWTLTDL
jgi:hypothetical protein